MFIMLLTHQSDIDIILHLNSGKITSNDLTLPQSCFNVGPESVMNVGLQISYQDSTKREADREICYQPLRQTLTHSLMASSPIEFLLIFTFLSISLRSDIDINVKSGTQWKKLPRTTELCFKVVSMLGRHL